MPDIVALNNEKTAVLVFANSAPIEAKRKSLLGKHRFLENQAIHQKLIDHTEAVVGKSGLEIFWFNETLQAGNTFGERIANAMQSVFQQGIDQLIIVGADSPGLGVKHIKAASKQLERDKMVLGPSVDGGVYLMAIHKANFKLDEFAALPWLQKHLLNAFADWAGENRLEVSRLKPLNDIDLKSELNLYLQQATSQLKIALTRIINLVSACFYELVSFYDPDGHLSPIAGRAPPTLQLIPIL